MNNLQDRGSGRNIFKVELQVKGEIFIFDDIAGEHYRKIVFEFDYENGQVRMISDNSSSLNLSNDWNIACKDL
ncbi:hypothetical protein [Clostridium gasigenes]|uniref:Uncharacterized protein n=1 Tax=Clostridium gasigenes TaxID=94869 RepID=A0A7X0SC69_9CLOT|nr:hypothetical protein [Clostridium gasigenes]MBB6714874.1 hypothetical protein [Clostridium gasigenes]